MKILHIIILSVFMVVVSACQHTTTRVSSDYSNYLSNNPSLAVLPPIASVQEVEFSGKTKQLYDFEYNIEQIIAESLLDIFRTNAFPNVQLLRRQTLHDLGVLGRVNSYIDNFSNKEAEIYRNGLEVAKNKNHIDQYVGVQLQSLHEDQKIDLLVLTKYSRAIKSSGSQVASAMFKVLSPYSSTTPADQSIISIFITDCKTGKMIWGNKGHFIESTYFSSDNKSKERKNLKEYLLILLKPLFEKKA